MKLSPLVKQQLEQSLPAIFSIWLSQPMEDYKHKVHPIENGIESYGLTSTIEPYRGPLTNVRFEEEVIKLPEYQRLLEAIQSDNPELLGWARIPAHHVGLSNLAKSVGQWCLHVYQSVSRNNKIDSAVKSLIEDLDGLLHDQTLNQVVIAPVSGLRIKGETHIKLSSNLTLSNLKPEEFSELFSRDTRLISGEIPMRARMAFVYSRKVNVMLTLNPLEPMNVSYREPESEIYIALQALHVLTNGIASIVCHRYRFEPYLLPIPGAEFRSDLLGGDGGSGMEILPSQFGQLSDIFTALSNNTREEVKIASHRLFEAEKRISPIDSTIDAIIGIEALLNPHDQSELAFRVALNYAFLGPENERRKRYDQIKDIQKFRNKIVHRGLVPGSKDFREGYQHAIAAKQVLRSILNQFLVDKDLATNKPDADFWLDRIIPR